jgi:transcriptional regulator with XRE-family HTH domain
VLDLAHKTGARRSTIIRAERGEHLVRAGTLQRLAEACGVTTNWILTGRTDEA